MQKKKQFVSSTQTTDNIPYSHGKSPFASSQLVLKLEIPPQGVLRGIEMGVLPDGTPFLSQRGVAEICGVQPSVITEFAQEVAAELGGSPGTARVQALRDILGEAGWHGPISSPLTHQGRAIVAYPDTVVVAFLQYYAFNSRTPSEKAVRALGTLARKTLRDLVYAALGFEPGVARAQRAIVERALLNEIPADCFSVFTESLELLTRLARANVDIGPHTVPDISVGGRWSEWWVEKNLDQKYGQRRKHPHRYPADHPQSAANAVMEVNVYPLAALGEFKIWLRDQYVKVHLKTYLDSKVAKKQLTPETAMKALQALTPRRLGS